MKIKPNLGTKFRIINKEKYNCVGETDTYEQALNFVKDNWVEGEGFQIEIMAVTRWQAVTLCEITDSDPLDEVDPAYKETIKIVMDLLAKQK
jgi:hypothetical protein